MARGYLIFNVLTGQLVYEPTRAGSPHLPLYLYSTSTLLTALSTPNYLNLAHYYHNTTMSEIVEIVAEAQDLSQKKKGSKAVSNRERKKRGHKIPSPNKMPPPNKIIQTTLSAMQSWLLRH